MCSQALVGHGDVGAAVLTVAGFLDTGLSSGIGLLRHRGQTSAGSASTARTACTARATWSSVRSARAVSRSRDTPSGTDGGRKQPTRTPSARSRAAASTARPGSPTSTDTTAPRRRR